MALINLPGRTSSSTVSVENKGGVNDVNVEEIGSIEVTDSGEEEYTVQRGLKSRHIQLIALGGAIGTGLFVGSGAALASAGPAGILTAYLIISFFVWTIMNQLGEMITYIPQAGKSTISYCSS
ncbi:unnamed protein product [[Candida] boidinii]|nr:unnamed protein product [[Candida] boidinii]